MNGLEIKAFRLLMGLSQSEAAAELGKVTHRGWRFWERYGRRIPLDVQDKIRELIQRRRETLDHVRSLGEKTSQSVVIFYDSPQDAGLSLLEVRYNNALAATLAFDFGKNLVKFEPQVYIDWLVENGLIDSPAKRSEWAVHRFLELNQGQNENESINGLELKVFRNLLGLSLEEAGAELGGVTPRGWLFWETRAKKIPLDVQQKIRELIQRRRETLDYVRSVGYFGKEASRLVVIFYDSPQDAGLPLLEVRHKNSLAATLAFDFGANLIQFEPQVYMDWLVEKGFTDSPAKRGEWAIQRFVELNNLSQAEQDE